LPHPALSAAAADHADYLTGLGEQHELLRRQVMLVLREPNPSPQPVRSGTPQRTVHRGGLAAETRLARRLSEAVELLAPAGITVVPLGPDRAAAVLAAACHPGRLLPPTPPAHPADITTGRWAA